MNTKIKVQALNNGVELTDNRQDNLKTLGTKEKGDILQQIEKPPTKRIGVALPQFASSKLNEAKSIEEFTNEEELQENAEILDIPLPFRCIGTRSSLTNVHNLLQQCSQPQAPLINKQLKTLQLNVDQAHIMGEQIKKMKTGIERLQSILQKCNNVEELKKDIEFIISNVGPAITKAKHS